MVLAIFLLVCQFLCVNGEQMHKNRVPGLKNGTDTRCKLTKKAAISQPQWQVKINKTTHFLGVIMQNSSLETTMCSKSIKALLTRDRNHQLTAGKPNVCVLTNSCAAAENHVTLTVLIPSFSAKRQNDLKDRLVTTCRNARGGLTDSIVWISSSIPMRGKYKTKQQNASRTVISNYKSTQRSNSLENITCLISHPAIFTPLVLFVRCPFRIRIKSNSHSTKGRKNKFIFNANDSEGIIQIDVAGFVEQVDLSCSKKNGSLPEGIELIKNNLTFKGPMKESYAGTYVCAASSQHWKLSAQWEIEITSDENQWIPTRALLIAFCVAFVGTACFFNILRWHRRKQLVVIPQQYSVQNLGYQTTIEDCHCIETQQDPRSGAGTVFPEFPKKH